MKVLLMVALGVAAAGCSIQRLGPPGVVLTRPVAVPARDVMVFQNTADIRARFAVVEEVWIKDDGDLSPREMESHLRVQAVEEVVADDEFEEHEAKARAQGEPGVEQPEIDFGMRIARRGG